MTSTASSRGRANRLKGKRGEREVINDLQPIVESVYLAHGYRGDDVPTLARNTLAWASGGSDVYGLSWLSIEIKRQETLAVGAWWRQCVEQATKAKAEPVLIYRGNGRAWSVRMQGYLSGMDGGSAIRALVTVDLDTFKQWFHMRLCEEVTKQKV